MSRTNIESDVGMIWSFRIPDRYWLRISIRYWMMAGMISDRSKISTRVGTIKIGHNFTYPFYLFIFIGHPNTFIWLIWTKSRRYSLWFEIFISILEDIYKDKCAELHAFLIGYRVFFFLLFIIVKTTEFFCLLNANSVPTLERLDWIRPYRKGYSPKISRIFKKKTFQEFLRQDNKYLTKKWSRQ